MKIRPATDRDTDAIAHVHTISWQAVYRGHFPDSYLDNIDVTRRAETWRRVSLDGSELVVAESENSIIGFLHLCQSRDEDADDSTDEISSIYFVPDCWSKGQGRQLMDWALDRSKARGSKQVTLWVLEGNDRARGFYGAMGFHLDGTTKAGQLGDGFNFIEVRYLYEHN